LNSTVDNSELVCFT